MTDLFSLAGFGITAAALAAVLKRTGGEFPLLISLAAGAVILFSVITSLSPVTGLIESLSKEAGTASLYVGVLMKALAVCYITQTASDCCRDSGESAIASKIELAGRAAVLVLSVPLFESILGIAKGLIV